MTILFGRRATEVLFAAVLCAPSLATGAETNSATATEVGMNEVDFDRDVQPIFEHNCIRCHGETRSKGGFRLDNSTSALRGGKSGPAIVPGHSAKSALIDYVRRVDPDSAMPPDGAGEPLSTTQIELLRRWVDDGAWWSRKEVAEQFTFTLAPTAGFVSVSGNAAKFREHQWLRDGWRGGVESLELAQQISPETKLVITGRAVTDDYRLEFQLEKRALGFTRFGFEQFRRYDADIGGYFPGFTQPSLSLQRDLHLDIGRVWFDAGLTLPDWPRFVLGYELQYRNGDKATLQWGAVSEGLASRNIFPASKALDERTHVLKFDAEYAPDGWLLAESFRGEWTASQTRRENVGSVALDVPNSLVRTSVREGWNSFQGANTFRVERQLREWCYASGGYLYSHLAADADFNLDTFNPSGAPISSIIQSLQDTSQRILLERESHVGNLNLLFGPWQNSTLAFGAQSEWTRQNGTLEGVETQFIAPPFNGPPFNFADIVSANNAVADIDRLTVTETALLRNSSLPCTTLFADARSEQEWIGHSENVNAQQTFLRDTDADSHSLEVRTGFDSSPLAWLKVGANYRWQDKRTTYDDHYGAGDPLDIFGYPTFITARAWASHEVESRLTLRPNNWLKATLTHRFIASTFHTATEPLSIITPGDLAPGDRRLTGDYTAHHYSLNLTLTPWRRLHCYTTIAYQETSSLSLHDDSAAVAPYRGETWSLLCHGRYVLTDKTDLTAGYSFSTANFQQDNFASGLPLGMNYDLHGVQVGLVSRCSAKLTTKLSYGFYRYAEPSSGGANDYIAHAIFASLNLKLD